MFKGNAELEARHLLEQVHTYGGNAHEEDLVRSQALQVLQNVARRTKVSERPVYAAEVFAVVGDPEVDVFRVTGTTVKAYGVSADQEIANFLGGECR